MAVAHVNQDTAQMNATEQFLKSGFITVDIFAVSPVDDDAGPDRDDAARGRRSAGHVHVRGGRRSGAERRRR